MLQRPTENFPLLGERTTGKEQAEHLEVTQTRDSLFPAARIENLIIHRVWDRILRYCLNNGKEVSSRVKTSVDLPKVKNNP